MIGLLFFLLAVYNMRIVFHVILVLLLFISNCEEKYFILAIFLLSLFLYILYRFILSVSELRKCDLYSFCFLLINSSIPLVIQGFFNCLFQEFEVFLIEACLSVICSKTLIRLFILVFTSSVLVRVSKSICDKSFLKVN